MNFSGLLLSRAFLMWLRPTPLAPAGKEGRKLEPGSGGATAPLQLYICGTVPALPGPTF